MTAAGPLAPGLAAGLSVLVAGNGLGASPVAAAILVTPAEAVVAPGDAGDMAAMLAPGGAADDMLWGCTAAKLAAVTLANIATNERFNITAPQPAGP